MQTFYHSSLPASMAEQHGTNARREALHGTLIHNPIAGPKIVSANLSAAHALFAQRGWMLRVEETARPGDASVLARAAAERGDDMVIVAGGDGTINEAIQGLAGTATALGVLPFGTVNLWAREIGLPAHPVAAAAALAAGVIRSVDLGRAGDRFFLLMAGAGFDGAVTGLVEPRLKRAMGRWAYVFAAARLALRYGGAEATLEMDHNTVRCRLLLAVIGNTRLYAGQFTMAASALADDGMLDVVVVPGRRLWQALPLLLPLLLRRHPIQSGVLYYRTQHLRITASEPLPVQADGDYIGATPLDFGVSPAALRVIVPRVARTPLFSLPIPLPKKYRHADES